MFLQGTSISISNKYVSKWNAMQCRNCSRRCTGKGAASTTLANTSLACDHHGRDAAGTTLDT